MKQPITTTASPSPIGPCSQGISTDSQIFVAGQGRLAREAVAVVRRVREAQDATAASVA